MKTVTLSALQLLIPVVLQQSQFHHNQVTLLITTTVGLFCTSYKLLQPQTLAA